MPLPGPTPFAWTPWLRGAQGPRTGSYSQDPRPHGCPGSLHVQPPLGKSKKTPGKILCSPISRTYYTFPFFLKAEITHKIRYRAFSCLLESLNRTEIPKVRDAHSNFFCVFILAPVFRDQQSFRPIGRDYFLRSRLSINICRGKKRKTIPHQNTLNDGE